MYVHTYICMYVCTMKQKWFVLNTRMQTTNCSFISPLEEKIQTHNLNQNLDLNHKQSYH